MFQKEFVMMSIQSEAIEQELSGLKVNNIFQDAIGHLFVVVSYNDKECVYHKKELWKAIPVIDGYNFSYASRKVG